jgi:hypothetical protein
VGIYSAFTDAELAEMLTEDERFAALEERKQQALRVLLDITLTVEQLEVRHLLHASSPTSNPLFIGVALNVFFDER